MVRAKRHSLISGKEYSLRYLLYLPVLIMAWVERNSPTDLDIYLDAAQDYLAGANPYLNMYHQWYHYYYSQFFALMMSLPAQLNRPVVHMCWMLLQFYFAEQSFSLLHKQSQTLTESRKKLFSIVLVLASLRFVYENLHYGQVSLMLLWLCLKAYEGLRQKNEVLAGGMLAVGINIKILPLPGLALLFLRRKWRSLVFVAVFLALLGLIPMLYSGSKAWVNMSKSHWSLINPFQDKHVQDNEEDSFHSLTTFLTVFFSEQPPHPLYCFQKRNIASLDLKGLQLLILIVRLVFFLSLFWIMFRSKEKRIQKYISSEEWFFLLFLIPMTFPHQQHYAFVFIIPLFSYLLAQALKEWDEQNPKGKQAFYLLVFPAGIWSLKLILGEFNPWYEYYKILTWSGLWLWVFSLVRIKETPLPPEE